MQAEPNWEKMYEWARNKARVKLQNKAEKLFVNEPTRFVRGNRKQTVRSGYVNYWADEMASAAVCHLHKEWRRYEDRLDHEFRLIIGTILHHAMLRVLRDQKVRDRRTDSFDAAEGEDIMMESAVHDRLERQRLEHRTDSANIMDVENALDLETEWAGFFDTLTPSELRVLPECVNNPGATSDEVAAWGGFRTGGAVRLHQMNIRNKSKSFISKHPNKTEWQLYLENETPNETSGRS